MSGCINACCQHHAGHIGILGVDRKGTENYQLLLGGSGAEDASLGQITGPGFDEDGIVNAVEKATDVYKAHREPRSEEHTSELQSLMRISYAVFCLKRKKNKYNNPTLEHKKKKQHTY